MRCINADDIVYESIDSSDTCRHESYYGTGILAVRKEDIDAMPNIEPERKTGKWIDDCECSVCHWINEDDGGDTLLTYYNYCPNCGAKNGG